MKKNNLKVIKINKTKSLFNYEKKVLIKELVLGLKLGYFDFEKEKPQKVKFNLEVNYQDKEPSNDKDIKSIVKVLWLRASAHSRLRVGSYPSTNIVAVGLFAHGEMRLFALRISAFSSSRSPDSHLNSS